LNKDKTPWDKHEPSTIKDDYDSDKAKYRVFRNAFDHEGQHHDVVEKELQDVKVLETSVNKYRKHEGKELGRRCLPFDWVAVHWTSKMEDRGHSR